MIKNTDRVPLSSIDLLDEPLSPLKPTIKILKKRLPNDFFNARPGIYSSTAIVRNSEIEPPTTSNLIRKTIKQEFPAREILTARDYKNNDQDLILGILKNAREMKKVFRKHSVQLKKQAIVLTRRIKGQQLQLPPLILKKAMTTPI